MLDNLFTPTHALFLIFPLLFVLLPFWRIFQKAGFPGALSLLMLVPFVNLAMLFVLAYVPWKPNTRQPINTL
jgi:hypothetical protein